MLVRVYGTQGCWIGEPRQVDGTPITSAEALAAYLEDHNYVLLYLWANGETQQRQAPRVINSSWVESWEETDFTDVIRNLPDARPKARRRHKRRRREAERQRR